MVSKSVVRNADDFGLNKIVNRAVLDEYIKGNIDTMSLMVTTKGFNDAVKMAHRNELEPALHLSLTTPTRSYRMFLLEYFTSEWNRYRIYDEFDNQIKEFKATGLPLDRIDSHHGVHFLPAVWTVLMALMEKHNITYVRNPPRKFCWFNPNLKLWIGKNKSWLFYHINKMPAGIKPLPYTEEIYHPK